MNGYSFVVALIAVYMARVIVETACATYKMTRQETIHKTVDDLRKRLLRQEAFAGEKHHLYEQERRRANHHREKARKLRVELFELRKEASDA